MKRMENRSIEGDRPVIENPRTPKDFLSNTMHVKLRMNLRRPRHKPKYSLATDSEQVPRGKGEKNRCERSEIVPEMMCLQGVKAQHFLIQCRHVLRVCPDESENWDAILRLQFKPAPARCCASKDAEARRMEACLL